MSGRITRKVKKEEATNAKARPQPKTRASSSFVSKDHPADALHRSLSAPLSAVKAGDILTLQRAFGNRAALRMMQGLAPRQTAPMRGSSVQTKLMVGAVNDTYEQEADRVAQQVVSMPAPMSGASIQRDDEEELQRKSIVTSITPVVQREENEEEIQMKPERQPAADGSFDLSGDVVSMPAQVSGSSIQREEEEELQRKPIVTSITPVVQREEDEEEIQMKPERQPAADGSFDVSGGFENSLSSLESGGRRLPDDVRGYMEPRFGADFNKVRIHTDDRADQFNQAILARAFTKGQHIFFRHGAFAPESHSGKALLAHELTHVLQQSGGSTMAQRQTGGETPCQCQPKEKELQRSPDLKTREISTTTVIQRDACFIPKSKESLYEDVQSSGYIGPGEKFSKTTRRNILEDNFLDNATEFKFTEEADIQKDDFDDSELLNTATLSYDVANVDHIVPESKGGCNHPKNAQILSSHNNSSKGQTYPWGDGYTGTNIYDPNSGVTFTSVKAAYDAQAALTTLQSKGLVKKPKKKKPKPKATKKATKKATGKKYTYIPKKKKGNKYNPYA
ncbi:MAG TPA: DUF4157 domain-containing protein [Blastocatellia bacterium]|nr:DUF4157 domain-containing protein [Blastocatellia bacterium]